MRRLSGLAALALLFMTGTASAFDDTGGRKYTSPQNFAIEVRFGPYKPQVDQEPALNGATPYAGTFGSAPRLLPAIEFDWQALRIPWVGSLGPGVSIGYTKMSAASTTLTTPPQPSGDTTSLTILPMTLVAVLRADSLWRNFGIPLVPYAKVGFGYALWNATNTGIISDAFGVKGRGHSFGTNLALGLAFALNVFEPEASRSMDIASGINNTYVFAEAYWLALNGFGSSSTLRVGSNTWTAGLAFEF